MASKDPVVLPVRAEVTSSVASPTQRNIIMSDVHVLDECPLCLPVIGFLFGYSCARSLLQVFVLMFSYFLITEPNKEEFKYIYVILLMASMLLMITELGTVLVYLSVGAYKWIDRLIHAIKTPNNAKKDTTTASPPPQAPPQKIVVCKE